MSSLLLLSLATSSSQECTDAGSRGLNTARFDTAQAWLDGYANGTGMVFVVQRDGHQKIFTTGMRDREAKTPMSADTLFRVCSMTKPIISVAAMTLVEDGVIALQDSVEKFVPEFKDMKVASECEGAERCPASGYELVDAARAITVHDLLSHTGGLSYNFFGTYLSPFTGPNLKKHEYIRQEYIRAGVTGDGCMHKNTSLESFVAALGGAPLFTQPGEFSYGLHSDCLGRVIEVASGLPLDEFLRERIFKPLGMADTTFRLHPEASTADAERAARLVKLYRHDEAGELTPCTSGKGAAEMDDFESAQHSYDAGPRQLLSGGCGLLSTAPDYAKFMQMLADGGAGVISRLTLGRMLAPTDLVPRVGVLKTADYFGLGFGVTTAQKEVASPGTFGWGGLHQTNFFVDPAERLSAGIFTNCHGFSLACFGSDHQKKYLSVASSLAL